MRTSLASIIELHRRADQCTRLMRSVTDVQTKAALLLLAADIRDGDRHQLVSAPESPGKEAGLGNDPRRRPQLFQFPEHGGGQQMAREVVLRVDGYHEERKVRTFLIETVFHVSRMTLELLEKPETGEYRDRVVLFQPFDAGLMPLMLDIQRDEKPMICSHNALSLGAREQSDAPISAV